MNLYGQLFLSAILGVIAALLLFRNPHARTAAISVVLLVATAFLIVFEAKNMERVLGP